MTPATEPPADLGADLEADLRAELVRAAVRRHDRRLVRTRGSVAALVGVLVAGVVVLGVLGPRPAQAGVRVDLAAGRINVTLQELEHDPEQIEAIVRGTGLSVSVVAVPVGPSDVGRFVGEAGSLGLPAAARLLDPSDGTFLGFSLPIGWPGAVELRVGRPARGDEPYARFADAVAPGGPLACRAILGRPLDAVAPELRRLPLDIVVQVLGPPPGAVVPLRAVGPDVGRLTVVRADATSRRRVLLEVSAQPTALPSDPRC